MSGKDNIVKLHSTLASGAYNRKEISPELQALMDKPHMAIFLNGDWLPILPGMIIGLIKNRAHVDGIAPYIFKKINLKEGKEFIDLMAWTTDRTSGRKLQFLANYSGVFRSGVNNADEAIEGAVAAKQMAADKDDD